jgi:hypothetical protein
MMKKLILTALAFTGTALFAHEDAPNAKQEEVAAVVARGAQVAAAQPEAKKEDKTAKAEASNAQEKNTVAQPEVKK